MVAMASSPASLHHLPQAANKASRRRRRSYKLQLMLKQEPQESLEMENSRRIGSDVQARSAKLPDVEADMKDLMKRIAKIRSRDPDNDDNTQDIVINEKDIDDNTSQKSEVYAKHKLLVEIGIGVILLVLLFVTIRNLFDRKSGQLPSTDRCKKCLRQPSQVFGKPYVLDTCDITMVFPLRGTSAKYTHYSGTHLIRLDWDQTINGLEKARAIFQDPNKPHLVSNDELVEKFSTEMKVDKYHATVCHLLVKLFAGSHFGLKMEAFASMDADEVFLNVNVPRDGLALQQYAADFMYFLPLNDASYAELGMSVPEDECGRKVRARAEFAKAHPNFFMPFSRSDWIRLLKARIDKFIDLGELMSQKVLAEVFAAHDWEEVGQLCDDWGRLSHWHQLPDAQYEDRICEYFGEEAGWLFVWQACFTRALLFPACLGALVFFRRYIGLPLMGERLVALLYTLVMVFWATIFNAWWKRYESAVNVRWGMDRYRDPISKRNEYVPADEGSWGVVLAHILGDICAFVMIGIVIVGVFYVQSWRYYILGTVQGVSQGLVLKIASFVQTLEILIIDYIWVVISRMIVNKENHAMQIDWNHSWVHKVFLVRIFNNLYPFIYIGFIKQFSAEGCPATEGGCLDELETNLFMYFLIRIALDVATDIYFLVIMEVQVIHELHKAEADHKVYSYLQVQAKCSEYDDWAVLNDWTDLLMTFTFLACFNVVLPSIAPIAFLNSLFQARCWAYRNLRLLRRPFPVAAPGIGAWQNLFESAEVVAVIVNTAFAVFAMRPLKDLSPIMKGSIFIGAQYAIHIVKFLIHVKVPSVPKEVQNFKHTNKEVVRRRFMGLETQPVKTPTVEQEIPDVGPEAFHGS